MEQYFPKLSDKEKEVLELLTKEFLTIKQISNRRQTSLKATYKIVNKLKEKGVLNYKFGRVQNGGGSSTIAVQSHTNIVNSDKMSVRLHGEAWKVQLLSHSKKYDSECIGKVFKFEECDVQCHLKSVCIYVNKSFFGVSGADAARLSSAYLVKFLIKLEHLWKISLYKYNVPNLSRFRAHYAHVDDATAKLAESKNEKIALRGKDGKIWLLADKSFSLNELETVHPVSSDSDMDKVVLPFYDNLKEYYEVHGEVPKFTNFFDLMNVVVKNQTDISENALKPLTVQIIKHLKVMDNMDKSWTNMNDKLEKMNGYFDKINVQLDPNNRLKPCPEQQRETSSQNSQNSSAQDSVSKRERVKKLLEDWGW